MEGLWEKRSFAAYPVDDAARKFFNKLPNGTRWVSNAKDPTRRSGQQHRLWFAIVGTLFENQEKYADFEQFRARLLVHLGYFERIKLATGEEIAMPKSVAWGNMKPDVFGPLLDETLNFAEDLGWDRAELLAQTREYAGLPA